MTIKDRALLTAAIFCLLGAIFFGFASAPNYLAILGVSMALACTAIVGLLLISRRSSPFMRNSGRIGIAVAIFVIAQALLRLGFHFRITDVFR